MTNVLIRGLSDEAVERIDAAASDMGLSRNEFLRRKLEGAAPVNSVTELTEADWERSAAAFADLADGDVMDAAWR